MKLSTGSLTIAVFAVAFATANMVSAQSMGRGGSTTGGSGFGTTNGSSTNGSTNGGQGSTSGSARQNAGGGDTESIGRDSDRTLSDVGTQTNGARTGLGGLGALGGLGGFGGGGFGGLSPFGLNPFGTGANAAEAKPTIRTRLRSEVVVPPRAPLVTQSTLQYQVSRSLSQPRFQGVGATFNGSTAIIAGTVRSEQDRRMAELLLRLEPGVSQIDNQIRVVP
ncbi:MAG: BON domain-containing protein [Planctomycetaceae bacterium]